MQDGALSPILLGELELFVILNMTSFCYLAAEVVVFLLPSFYILASYSLLCITQM
jgi:hypothetical protein